MHSGCQEKPKTKLLASHTRPYFFILPESTTAGKSFYQ